MKLVFLTYFMLICTLALSCPAKDDIQNSRDVDQFTEPVTGMKFVKVEGGCFQMGCGKWFWEKNCEYDEKPVRKICLSPFYIGRHEVTQHEWNMVMDDNPSFAQKCGFSCPVEMISFDEVQLYIKRLNNLAGKGNQFRLPTEAEWEYACRSRGKPELFCGGSDNTDLAWFRVTSKGRSHPVGEMQPNRLGIYDMSGNVWEWCSDYYSHYRQKESINPKGPSEGQSRVVRGGSWGDHYSRFCRSTYRNHYLPYHKSKFIGFRLVMEIKEVKNHYE